MKEIQRFGRFRPPLRPKLPDPMASVGQHQGVFGSRQSRPQRFPVQTLAELHRLSLPAHHHLLRKNSPFSFLQRLLLSIENAGLQFVPFDPVFIGLFLSPARTTKAYLPARSEEHTSELQS